MLDCKSCKTNKAVGTKLYLGDSEPCSNPIQYRSVLSAFQYLNITRLDLSFVVNKLN